MYVEHVGPTSSRSTCKYSFDTLLAVAGQFDRTAEDHSIRVTKYSLAVGRIAGLSPDELADLKYAAALHDIGEVSISSRTLHKLGKLTEEEFRILKRHSELSLRILEKIERLQPAALIIRHHHERYDGKGYPDGLAGISIPLGSRIIAVAEAFDILTSNVPWRRALDKESALAELEKCAGTQFDPDIVVAFRIVISNRFMAC